MLTYQCILLSSAYCGGLWLASLRVMQEIANVLEVPDEAVKYVNILKRGKKAYHAVLWNGNLFSFICFLCFVKPKYV